VFASRRGAACLERFVCREAAAVASRDARDGSPGAAKRVAGAGAAQQESKGAAKRRKRFAAPQPPAEKAGDADPLSLCHVDMRGAAVADAELPPLGAGEVRVLGQTLSRPCALARARAVADWRRLGGDKRQWAEVLSPMCDADKAALLRSLRTFLGIPAGQELACALPADRPCDALVEAFTIPEDDPRAALRGQAGVRVRRGKASLPRFAVVGPYRAITLTLEEYNLHPGYKYGIDERIQLPRVTHPAPPAADAPQLNDQQKTWIEVRLCARVRRFDASPGSLTRHPCVLSYEDDGERAPIRVLLRRIHAVERTRRRRRRALARTAACAPARRERRRARGAGGAHAAADGIGVRLWQPLLPHQ